MKAYETSSTVQEQGQIFVAGVPFPPGTHVDILISPARQSMGESTLPDEDGLSAARDQMRQLFRTIKGFRNSPRLSREELYERGRVH